MNDKIIKTANKGEWAEFYTHLKILVDKMVVKGDKNLNPDITVTYPVLTIIKSLNNGDVKKISITKNGFSFTQNDSLLLQFKDEIITSKISKIFERILVGTDNPEGYLLSKEISLPIKNQLKKKADITLNIEDPHTLSEQILGFSIKSKITSQPSLINASPATKFTFLIEGSISEYDIEEINSITGSRKIRDRIKSITDKELKLIPFKAKSLKFQENLKHFDSQFEIILGNFLLVAYSGKKDFKSILNSEEFKHNVKHLNLSKEIIENKVKDFLMAFALGMEPAKKWSGVDDVNGGILWVKKDGSIVCHHLFERKELKEYLFENTFFDSPSTTRHKYGFIYEYDGSYCFDLCLQVRFY